VKVQFEGDDAINVAITVDEIMERQRTSGSYHLNTIEIEDEHGMTAKCYLNAAIVNGRVQVTLSYEANMHDPDHSNITSDTRTVTRTISPTFRP